MIISYEDYKLNGFPVFERVAFQAPFKPSVTYEQEACFIYSLTGSGVSYGGVEQSLIQPKESLLMKCGSFLNHWTNASEGEACRIIAIHVTPSILEAVYEGKIPGFLNTHQAPSHKILQKIPQHLIIDEFIKGLLFYFDNPALMDEHLLSLKIKELILLLYNLNYPGIRELLQSLFKPIELSFKSIIQAHLFEDISIKDLAALTNTSTSTFKRKFRQIFNDTPGRYILEKRLEHAASLLRHTDKRITEICFDSGFSNLSYFSKTFSVRYGSSPSNYRQDT